MNRIGDLPAKLHRQLMPQFPQRVNLILPMRAGIGGGGVDFCGQMGNAHGSGMRFLFCPPGPDDANDSTRHAARSFSSGSIHGVGSGIP